MFGIAKHIKELRRRCIVKLGISNKNCFLVCLPAFFKTADTFYLSLDLWSDRPSQNHCVLFQILLCSVDFSLPRLLAAAPKFLLPACVSLLFRIPLRPALQSAAWFGSVVGLLKLLPISPCLPDFCNQIGLLLGSLESMVLRVCPPLVPLFKTAAPLYL